MSHDYLTDAHIASAQSLLELILPNSDELEEMLEQFDAQLEDASRDEKVLDVLSRAVGAKAFFQSDIQDNDRLIESLSSLASQWDAYIRFGSRDWEGEYTQLTETSALVEAAALELHEYGLQLWYWQADEEVIVGWIARESDDDLIEKLCQQCETIALRGEEISEAFI